jgi:hypothetical protein
MPQKYGNRPVITSANYVVNPFKNPLGTPLQIPPTASDPLPINALSRNSSFATDNVNLFGYIPPLVTEHRNTNTFISSNSTKTDAFLGQKYQELANLYGDVTVQRVVHRLSSRREGSSLSPQPQSQQNSETHIRPKEFSFGGAPVLYQPSRASNFPNPAPQDEIQNRSPGFTFTSRLKPDIADDN